LVFASDPRCSFCGEGNRVTQLIWTGTEYEEADATGEAKTPEWPVQDGDGRWYDSEDFEGQKVCYLEGGVSFGFLAKEVPEEDLPYDEDGCVDFDAAHKKFGGPNYCFVGRRNICGTFYEDLR